jgi:hypothetical protein
MLGVVNPKRTQAQQTPASPAPVRAKSPAPASQPAPVRAKSPAPAPQPEKKIGFSEPIPTQRKAELPPVVVPRRGSIGGLQSLTKNLMDHDTQISDLKALITRQDSIIKSYENSSKRLESVVKEQEKIIAELKESLDEVING